MPRVKKEEKKEYRGRWDTKTCRWISPVEEFTKMAKKVGWSYEQLYEGFRENAENNAPGFDQYCKGWIEMLPQPQKGLTSGFKRR